MSSPAKLNEYNHAEEPARVLLERLGWTYVPRNELAAERVDEREVLLRGRLQRALLRLNEWMTEEQADRAVFALEHLDVVPRDVVDSREAGVAPRMPPCGRW